MEYLEQFFPILKQWSYALVILVIGLIIIKKVTKRLEKRIDKFKMDKTLQPFFVSALNITLKIFLALVVVKIIGIDTSSFIAVLASAGFAIGLAFQGSLSNFAGGVLLMTQRPFETGDFIQTGDFMGTVKGIKILYTELSTIDNKIIFIPNGILANDSITNFSAMTTRRVDLKFGVGYNTKIEKVKELINKEITAHELILKDPEPVVRLTEHADSALIFAVKVWVDTDNYWTVYYDMMERVKESFDKNKIEIPFPQMDVNVKEKR